MEILTIKEILKKKRKTIILRRKKTWNFQEALWKKVDLENLIHTEGVHDREWE